MVKRQAIVYSMYSRKQRSVMVIPTQHTDVQHASSYADQRLCRMCHLSGSLTTKQQQPVATNMSWPPGCLKSLVLVSNFKAVQGSCQPIYAE